MPDQREAVVQRMIDAGESEDNIALVIREMSQATPAEKPWYRKSPDDLQTVQQLRSDGFGGMIDGAMSGSMSSAAPVELGKQGIRVIQGLARRLYGGLAKVKDETLERFPNVVDDLVENRRVLSQGGRRKTVESLQRIGSQKRQVLDAADASGARVSREQLRGGLDEALDDAIARSDTPVKDMNKLAAMERDLIPDEATVLPSRADAIKSKLYSESDRAYRGIKMGTRVNDTGAKARVAVARRAKTGVESIAPEIAPINAAYASTKGQATALREALKRNAKNNMIGGGRDWAAMGAAGLGALGGGPLGALTTGTLMRLLATPSTGSRIAIAADVASKRGADEALERTMRAILTEAGKSR